MLILRTTLLLNLGRPGSLSLRSFPVRSFSISGPLQANNPRCQDLRLIEAARAEQAKPILTGGAKKIFQPYKINIFLINVYFNINIKQ